MYIYIGMCYFLLVVLCQSVVGYPSPDFRDFFKGSSWVDKLPSLEVKFAPTGVTVSTGPSREELYWTIGYIVGGVVALTLVIIAVCLCMHKFYSRGDSRRTVHVRDVAMSPMMNPYLGNVGVNNPLLNPTILSSHFSQPISSSHFTRGSTHSGPIAGSLTPSHLPRNKPPTPSIRGLQNELYSGKRNNDLTTLAEDSPPPPYRSRS